MAALLGMNGCMVTSRPHLYVPDASAGGGTALDAILAAHPLAAEDNISVVPLGHTDSCSYHLVQVRNRERPHIHATHDLTVTVLQGAGQLYVHGAAREMRAGDVAVVPHGTPHYFVNSGRTPAVAFVTFAPPYDGKDQMSIPTE